ncbi:MAG: LLM class flavin-dependent oxidoreductase [Pseudomonadota bacterium]|jgi:alkanesulfonate monooxygenase SsuD/methylene tetrahydromethanopterin reductase-like flavin-dependent oxidoreductase (luciferase family)|nr:LLM class flavin-dependent oxidoreductase [Pseudomonadota bacterium]
MKVFAFHLMPYGALDMSYAEEHNSVWLKLPNSYFDPKIGHELYNRYLDELELAAEVGFDGISVNEHHQNAYGLMPSPVVMAAALARNTEKCKIAILGNAFALREHPLTLAEEHAMIDNITGGRLITGMVRGVGCEYFSMGVNPAYSLERHIEAHDLVVRAWTETGPFAFEGKHYHFEYVNMWPRPYQDPHPPIWCPSQGSTETIEWAAHPDRKYVYLQAYSAFESVLRYLNMYRSVAEQNYGYTASSGQIAWSVPVYCAETDEQAMEEVRPHIESLFNTFLPKISQSMFVPPGYMTASSMKKIFAHKATLRGGQKVEDLMQRGVIVVGSPDTVRDTLIERHRQAGFEHVLIMPQFGTLPADLTEKNLRLLGAEVVPALQALDENNYAGFELSAAAAE